VDNAEAATALRSPGGIVEMKSARWLCCTRPGLLSALAATVQPVSRPPIRLNGAEPH
jgi:hypothetical protein